MKFSSRFAAIALVSGAAAQDSNGSATYSAPTYIPPIYINTVGGPPNPTAVSAESSYIASQASVISFGSGGSSAGPEGPPLTTSTYVTNGVTYTVAVPAYGATTVVPVTAGGSTIYETIVIPTAPVSSQGSIPSPAHSPAIVSGPGPVAGSTYSNSPPPAETSQPVSSAAAPPPATTSAKPTTTNYQSVPITTTTTTPSQGVTTQTTKTTITTSPTSNTSTTTKVPTLTASIQSTLATIKPTPTQTITVGPVPPAHGAGSTFGPSSMLLATAVGLCFIAFAL